MATGAATKARADAAADVAVDAVAAEDVADQNLLLTDRNRFRTKHCPLLQPLLSRFSIFSTNNAKDIMHSAETNF